MAYGCIAKPNPNTPKTLMHTRSHSKHMQRNVIRLICSSLSGMTIRVVSGVCCTHHWLEAYASIRSSMWIFADIFARANFKPFFYATERNVLDSSVALSIFIAVSSSRLFARARFSSRLLLLKMLPHISDVCVFCCCTSFTLQNITDTILTHKIVQLQKHKLDGREELK